MIKRRDRILISALELFEDGGLNNITTKNLAMKEGISEPALYRQYKNKFEIIKAVIMASSSYDERIVNTIIKEDMSGQEAIEFYVSRYCELFQNYSEISLIVSSMDLYFYEDETRDMMFKILMKREDSLESYLDTHPLTKCTITHKTLAKLINDIVYSEVRRWRMMDKSYDLLDMTLKYVKEILEWR